MGGGETGMDNNKDIKAGSKLVNVGTIAKLFGLTERRVQQLTQDGVINAVREGRYNKYDLLQTIQRYIAYLQAKAKTREKDDWRKEAEAKALKAEAGLKETKAKLAALELEELESQMIRSELVEAATTDMLLLIDELINELPEKLKGIHKLDSAAEISREIKKHTDAALLTLSEHRFDPEAYEKRKAAYEARTRETGSILTTKRGGKTS